ncbi:MAG: efflux RND transporter periplasmic adaptor subunit [Verrucomicrobiota bacterium]
MKVFRVLTPLLILVVVGVIASYLIWTKPEPRKRPTEELVTRVDATRLKPQDFQVFVATQGSVRPRTTSVLIPEVSGRVVEVSPHFRDGGFFEKDEVLLKIDPINYETAVVVAESSVAQAERELREEVVRGEQAVANWRRIGKTGEPSEMVRRLPQLAEAEARLRAVKAQLDRARRDLERTEVKAPFAGRIEEQLVDLGQYVSPNTQLGRAFATDVMEVRLPLTNRELSFVELPETFRGEADDPAPVGPRVRISAEIGRHRGEWDGQVVRVDSSIDETSRQLFVVAEVQDPYRRANQSDGNPPLKIGMFVDALVEGVLLESVFVLPRQAVRVGGEVILVDQENRIRRQQISPMFADDQRIVVASRDGGLNAGDVICLTPLAYPVNGAPVVPTIDGVTPEVELPAGGPPAGIGKGGKKGKGKGGKSDQEPPRVGAANSGVEEAATRGS